MLFDKNAACLTLWIIFINFVLVASVVTCEYEWIGEYYTRECRDGFECCQENYDCCKIPHNPEEYLNTGVLIGAILGCVLLLFIIVSLVVGLKCGAKKRVQRIITRRNRNAVANMNISPSTDIQQPPPYNFLSYAPPPPYMGSSTNVRRDLAPYSGSATNAQRELPPYSGTTTNDHGTLPFLGYAPPTYTANARNALRNMPLGTI